MIGNEQASRIARKWASEHVGEKLGKRLSGRASGRSKVRAPLNTSDLASKQGVITSCERLIRWKSGWQSERASK